MLIFCDFQPEKLYDALHELIRLAFPGCELIRGTAGHDDMALHLIMEESKGAVSLKGAVFSAQGNLVLQREHRLKSSEKEKESSWLARRFIYDLLCQYLDKDLSPYGILTGMRPVKLVQRFIDQGMGRQKISRLLQEDYRLAEEKAELLLEVAENNRRYLLNANEANQWVSIYIGIPFCPSKCYYCSFPGAVLKDYDRDITPFVQALRKEMEAVAEYLQVKGISVQSVYLGGGTPTVLSAADLEELFGFLHNRFISGSTLEITVEAGRPDTMTMDKLRLLKDAGVNRICVNPQTMNDSTLELIGRNHNREGVVRAVERVRQVGIQQINMGLIVGLPGEGLREIGKTAGDILQLEPENITVHTLALKRGSVMALVEDRENVNDQTAEIARGVEYFSSAFRNAGYIPYYLYRQKYMKAGMENTGYSLSGHQCLYNIQMIEERQTIIGMGGGAASKFVDSKNWTLTSSYNPKDPYSYCSTVEKLIKRKVDKLWGLN